MEAMILGYPPEDKSKISVTATKQEWEDVVRFLKESPYWPPSHNSPVELVVELWHQGVRE